MPTNSPACSAFPFVLLGSEACIQFWCLRPGRARRFPGHSLTCNFDRNSSAFAFAEKLFS